MVRAFLLLTLAAGCGAPDASPRCRGGDPSFYTGAVSRQQGVAMVAICAGSFHMGSPASEEGHATHKPPGPREVRRRVILTHDFYIGRFAVTRAQAVTFLGRDPSRSTTCTRATCPVESISWHEAAALANGVSRAAGLTPCYRCGSHKGATRCGADPAFATPYGCPGFRLPTSAELEYATRAGTTTAFSSGDDLTPGHSKACRPDLTLSTGAPLARIAWFCGSSGKTTHEVGRLAPNPWGLHDVHGNVYSWCHDWYEPATAAPQLDPVGADPASGERVTRGGSWFTDPGPLRSAYRSSFPPHRRIDDLGLRLVRSLPPAPAPAAAWPGAAAVALMLLLIMVTAVWLAGRWERHEG